MLLERKRMSHNRRPDKERTCLKCNNPFPSESPGNRICPGCSTENKKAYDKDVHVPNHEGRVVRKPWSSDNLGKDNE